MHKSSISVIIPVYNSSENLKNLFNRLKSTLNKCASQFEVIFVNDGSADNSWEILKHIAKDDERVKIINLIGNFGQQKAVLCGFAHASLELIATMDDDLQQAPEDLPTLVEKLVISDTDIVMAKYKRKNHSYIRNFGTVVVKWINSKSIGIPPQLHLTSFRVIKSNVIKEVLKLNNPNPVIGYLLFSVTKNIQNVEVDHINRTDGKKSNYTFASLLKYFFSQMFEYSELPLKLVSVTGAVFSLSSFLIGAYYLIARLLGFVTVTGFTSIVLLICFLSGMTLLSLGIIGRYLIKIINSLNARPIYVIKEKNF